MYLKRTKSILSKKYINNIKQEPLALNIFDGIRGKIDKNQKFLTGFEVKNRKWELKNFEKAWEP